MRIVLATLLVLACAPAHAQHGGWNGRGGGQWHGGWQPQQQQDQGGAIIGGIIGGVIGGIFRPQPQPYYPPVVYQPPVVYVQPPVVYQQPQYDAVTLYCIQRFRSFNPQTGLFFGFDGQYHTCP
jgi:hypothetical protein